jgi:ketosteroid isomerase-like protein
MGLVAIFARPILRFRRAAHVRDKMEESPTMNSRPSAENEANVALVRSFYAAVLRGDVAAILDLLDPQVEWQAPESLPWGGTFHGHDGFREFFGKVLEQPVEFRREVREILDAGERIVVILRLMSRPRGNKTEFEVPEIHIWTVRHGKIVALEAYFDTAFVMRALQLQPRPTLAG